MFQNEGVIENINSKTFQLTKHFSVVYFSLRLGHLVSLSS